MPFNTAMCKLMNIRRQNQGGDYNIGDHDVEMRKLTINTNEHNFGIQICKVISLTIKSAMPLPQLTVMSRDPELWKRLYITCVKPHLEYDVQLWNPYAKKDVAT